jgi:hypothetical protein
MRILRRSTHVNASAGGYGKSGRNWPELVEFAVALPVFLVLVFGVMDLGRLYFTQITAQHALREAGRFAVTGNHLPDLKHPNQTLSRVDSILQVVRNMAPGIDVSGVQISSLNGGSKGLGRAGRPGYRDNLTVNLKLITPIIKVPLRPGWRVHIHRQQSFKNEPSPNQTK